MGHMTTTDNCVQSSCCNQTTVFSEIINTSSGYIDPVIGAVYPIYSVFGSTASNGGNAYNPQINRPMSGTQVLRLNKSNSVSGLEHITRTITVTNANSILDVAFMICVVGAHNCCESPGFKLTISTSTCSFLFNAACTGAASQLDFYEVLTGNPTTNINSPVFSKWTIKRFDLSDFINQPVVLEISAYRCIYAAHFGYAYIDAMLSAGNFTVNGQEVQTSSVTVPYCKSALILCPSNYQTYSWQGPAGFSSNQQSINVFTSGIYTVQMGAGDPCINTTKTLMVTFTPPPAVFTSTAIMCPGATAILSYTGGGSTSFWPHNGSVNPTVAVSPTITTTYTLISTDNSGCFSTALFTQSVFPQPILEYTVAPGYCHHQKIEIPLSGTSNYSWAAGNGATGTSTPVILPVPLSPGPLQFTAIGNSIDGCKVAVQFSTMIWPLPVPGLEIAPSHTLCKGSVLALRGSGGQEYKWSGPGQIERSGEFVEITLSELFYSGIYTLTVIDLHGCSAATTTPVSVIDLPAGYISESSADNCVPFCSDLHFISQDQEISKKWRINEVDFNGASYCMQQPGNSIISVTVTGKHGCVNVFTLQVAGHEKPEADFTYYPSLPLEGLDVVLLNDKSRGKDLEEFSWYAGYPAKEWEGSGAATSVIFDEAGKYPLCLVVRNAFGCRDTMIRTIEVGQLPSYYVPNTFSPNNDGRNDVFMPVLKSAKLLQLQVFNRWGALLYDGSSEAANWDGSFGGKSCQEGEYIWKMHLRLSTGEEKLLTGTILLVR